MGLVACSSWLAWSTGRWLLGVNSFRRRASLRRLTVAIEFLIGSCRAKIAAHDSGAHRAPLQVRWTPETGVFEFFETRDKQTSYPTFRTSRP